MEETFRKGLLESFNAGLTDIFTHYSTKIALLEEKVSNQNSSIIDLNDKYSKLQKDFNELKDDFESYKSVSVMKNLHKQIYEKDIIIGDMQKKIDKITSQNDVIQQTDTDPYSVTTPESVEEIEVSFIEKKLRGKIYYVSEDNDKEIYEKLPDGELGDCVGKYNENNRPIFFKKKN